MDYLKYFELVARFCAYIDDIVGVSALTGKFVTVALCLRRNGYYRHPVRLHRKVARQL